MALQLYRDGIEIPFPPGFIKCTVSDSHPPGAWLLTPHPTIAYLFSLLYNPVTWSEYVNTDIYQLVVLLLQTAQAHNVTIGGGAKYNVPSVEVAIDGSFMSATGAASSPSLTSYSQVAISGGDDFNDGSVTIKDVFDIIVNTTREVTPTCKFPIIHPYLFVLPPRP